MPNILTPLYLEKYLNTLKGDLYSNELIQKKLSSITTFIEWAITKGYITTDVFNQLTQVIAKFQIKLASEKIKGSTLNHEQIITKPKSLDLALNSMANIFATKRHLYIVTVVSISIAILAAFFYFKTTDTKIPNVKAESSKGKVLSFKGKLTDALGNAITNKTDVVFKLYSSPEATAPIYTGSCTGMNAVTPAIDGSISVNLGKDCSMRPISDTVFTDNSTLYLGITPGTDAEMLPRKQIANVGFSANANKLQGLGIGNSVSSIPVINQEGDLLFTSEQAGIRSTAKSAHFTLSGEDLVSIKSLNNDITLSANNGRIHLQTLDGNDAVDAVIINNNGNVGIKTVDPSEFQLQVAGDIGPNFTGIYSLGSLSNQWNTVYANRLYQNGNEVCDISNNCSSMAKWSSITDPSKDLSLDMENYSTTLTFGKATGSASLFNLKDTAYNTGTGFLFDITTGVGSRVNPVHISAAGTEAFAVTNAGRVGVGTGNPLGKFHAKDSGPKSDPTYTTYIENTSSNTSSNDNQKYGLYLSSTGSFEAGVGKTTTNYGLYINTTSGATANYDIYAASGAYLSTGGTWTNASSSNLKENFTAVDPETILAKINQLDVSSWNYKTENGNIRHLGPTAEQFYDIFQLGNNNHSISTIDPASIALVGIKALDKKITDIQKTQKLYSLSDYGEIEIRPNGPTSYTYSGNTNDIENTSVSVSSNGTIIKNVEAMAELIVGKIRTGLIVTKDAVVKNNLVAKNIFSENINSPVINTKEFEASEKAKLPKIETNQITALNDNVTIDLNATQEVVASASGEQKGNLASLIIKGLDSKAVTTIDAQGNIITDGNITSSTATVSGLLAAQSIETTNLQSNQVSANTASISGELVADNIRSKALDQIQDKINNTNSQVNDVQKLLAELQHTPLPEVSNYADLNLLAGTKSFNSIAVMENAQLYKASIVDSLIVGTLVVRPEALLSLSSNLNLSSLSTITFFDNAMVIAKDGSITTTGTITALGGIKTNTLSPATNKNIDVVLGASDSALEVKNDQNKKVASINNKGTAQFREISLDKYMAATSAGAIIAASDNLSQNGIYSAAIQTSSETAGIGQIPLQNNEVIIYNDSIINSSLVYLTSTSEPGNPLTLVKKEVCETKEVSCRPYFKVASSTVASTPLTFNWLIIN